MDKTTDIINKLDCFPLIEKFARLCSFVTNICFAKDSSAQLSPVMVFVVDGL